MSSVSKWFRFKHVINKHSIVRLGVDMKHVTGLVYSAVLQVNGEGGIWELLKMMELNESLPPFKW